ncbi:MAG: recombinase family protein [Carnobacterium alterfunditum]
MMFGYARVSSKDQNLSRQLKELKAYGCEEIYEEKESGKNFTRKIYQEMRKTLRSQDVVVVHDLSRFGRNKKEIKEEWEYLVSKKVDIVVLNMPILDTRKYKELEGVGQLVSDIVLSLFSWLVEEERLRIRTAQREGIKLAKIEGKFKGRPIKYRADTTNKNDRMVYDQIVKRLHQKESVMDIHNYTGVSRVTVYRIKKELDELKELE